MLYFKPSVGVPNESARQRRRMKMAGEGYPHPPVVRKSSSQSHSGMAKLFTFVWFHIKHYQLFLNWALPSAKTLFMSTTASRS